MTWPVAQIKTNVDAARDDPKLARSDLAATLDQFNPTRSHIISYTQGLLADDNAGKAASAAKKTSRILEAVDRTLLTGDDHAAWMKHEAEFKKILSRIGESKAIKAIRKDFAPLPE